MMTIKKMFLSAFGICLILSSCQEQKKENPQKLMQEVEEVVFEAPKQIISLEEADSLFVNYKKRRAANIIEMEAAYQEDKKPFIPTQFVSFDIEVLKDYIGYVEQEAKKGGVKADSLRIYLGNYGKKERKNARRNTVFIVPAAEVDGDYGGIFIGDNGKAELIRNWIKEQQKGMHDGDQKEKASFFPNFSSSPALYNGGSLTLNRGGTAPPPYGDF